MKLKVVVTKAIYTDCELDWTDKIDDFDNPINRAIRIAFNIDGAHDVFLTGDCFLVYLMSNDSAVIPLSTEAMVWLTEWRKWKRSWRWWKKLPELILILNMPNHEWHGDRVRRIPKEVIE